MDLAARQEDPRLSTTTGSLTATLSEGSFVPLTTTSSSASAGGTLTGQFTGGDGNAYPVTSYSNIVVVAGHSLSVGGPGALVGQVIVTEASQGFVANGQNITMMSVTNSPSTASSTMTGSGTTTSTRGPAGQSPAAQPTNSSSSSKAGVAVPMATGVVGAVLSGVLGALLL